MKYFNKRSKLVEVSFYLNLAESNALPIPVAVGCLSQGSGCRFKKPYTQSFPAICLAKSERCEILFFCASWKADAHCKAIEHVIDRFVMFNQFLFHRCR